MMIIRNKEKIKINYFRYMYRERERDIYHIYTLITI